MADSLLRMSQRLEAAWWAKMRELSKFNERHPPRELRIDATELQVQNYHLEKTERERLEREYRELPHAIYMAWVEAVEAQHESC